MEGGMTILAGFATSVPGPRGALPHAKNGHERPVPSRAQWCLTDMRTYAELEELLRNRCCSYRDALTVAGIRFTLGLICSLVYVPEVGQLGRAVESCAEPQCYRRRRW